MPRSKLSPSLLIFQHSLRSNNLQIPPSYFQISSSFASLNKHASKARQLQGNPPTKIASRDLAQVWRRVGAVLPKYAIRLCDKHENINTRCRAFRKTNIRIETIHSSALLSDMAANREGNMPVLAGPTATAETKPSRYFIRKRSILVSF